MAVACLALYVVALGIQVLAGGGLVWIFGLGLLPMCVLTAHTVSRAPARSLDSRTLAGMTAGLLIGFALLLLLLLLLAGLAFTVALAFVLRDAGVL